MVAVLNTAQGLEIKGLSENNSNAEEGKAAPEHKVHNAPVKRPQIVTENTDSGFKKRKTMHFTDVKSDTKTNLTQLSTQPAHKTSSIQTSEVLKVKEEVSPVTIDLDLDMPEQNGDCEEVGQELAYCQDLAAGFDMREVDRAYDGDFGQEEVDNLEQFENVSFNTPDTGC